MEVERRRLNSRHCRKPSPGLLKEIFPLSRRWKDHNGRFHSYLESVLAGLEDNPGVIQDRARGGHSRSPDLNVTLGIVSAFYTARYNGTWPECEPLAESLVESDAEAFFEQLLQVRAYPARGTYALTLDDWLSRGKHLPEHLLEEFFYFNPGAARVSDVKPLAHDPNEVREQLHDAMFFLFDHRETLLRPGSAPIYCPIRNQRSDSERMMYIELPGGTPRKVRTNYPQALHDRIAKAVSRRCDARLPPQNFEALLAEKTYKKEIEYRSPIRLPYAD